MTPVRAELVSGVILAAGSSTRLGRPKQLLELEGKPLLQHVVDAASFSVLGELVIVLGHRAPEVGAALTLPHRSRAVVNPDHARGQSTSLQAGIRACAPESDAVAILLGDQPRIGSDTIDAVVGAFRRSDLPVARARWGDVPGHPVVVHRSHWDVLLGATGDAGARDLLSSRPDLVLDVDLGEEAVIDVDTWEDVRALRGR